MYDGRWQCAVAVTAVVIFGYVYIPRSSVAAMSTLFLWFTYRYVCLAVSLFLFYMLVLLCVSGCFFVSVDVCDFCFFCCFCGFLCFCSCSLFLWFFLWLFLCFCGCFFVSVIAHLFMWLFLCFCSCSFVSVVVLLFL